MLTRQLQRDLNRRGSFTSQIRCGDKVKATALIWHYLTRLYPQRCADRHIALHTIRNNVLAILAHMWDQRGRACILSTCDQRSIGRKQVHELFKGFVYRRERWEEIRVVMFNARYHGNLRLKSQE